ncbi:mediator complex, subunit Med18 [Apodospora peruviana]|uniref:Mediator of RNA polymerase II transcription subunit 18 n=1 Tax=Apodospora peruviana TaxID=516989 RepID=A0AAE0M0W0_9PEZI|nr:mediator complex, subunit Med18 [Apodospora peruviana]
MPHEIFLTAIVPDDYAFNARAVLAGHTEMREQHRFTKVRYMRREEFGVKGLPTNKDLQKERGPNAALWQELHQIFLKQSYIIQERTDITDEIKNAGATDAITAGTPAAKVPRLRFNDLPDTMSSRHPQHNTQRKTLEIADPRLGKILADNKFTCKTESIEETYHWFDDKGLEYVLTRVFRAPAPRGNNNTAIEKPALSVAALGDPVAPFWTLFVSVRVESTPERMQQGHQLLETTRQFLTGVFDFRNFDRRAHDTRNMEPRQQAASG